ncbi:MAG: hypothetical protein A2Y77_02510 [Planctomycetes bacterium RBG_13_62_9]|nr:MAG: hypothetical protein A2Y77_02510 [Planctomycetes bacterium RBG_13_62_9]
MDIPKAVKEQILRQKVLKPLIQIEAGTKPYEIPAYVRYDLIAQTYQLLGKAKEVIAHQFLSASWATR